MNEKTFIIAEAGSNHNRDKKTAYKLIDAAVNANCSAVKFQTYSSATLYSKFTPDFGGHKNIPKLIENIQLPRQWQKDLKQYCDDSGIEFMSTPFDESAIEELVNLEVKKLKIAGFEATDPRFVKLVASAGLPIIVSLGIGSNLNTMNEVESWIREENADAEITFLHCNNAYPTPFGDINLGQMKKMIKHQPNKKIKIGLSDHTEGILTPPIAVALGAQVIEKHYTLNRNQKGPDHPFAIEPKELCQMVKNIRLSEKMLGIKKQEYSDSEMFEQKGRRSVVVVGNVKKGEKITKNNVTTKRPLLDGSVEAKEFFNILGRSFTKDLDDDSVLMWNQINQ